MEYLTIAVIPLFLLTVGCVIIRFRKLDWVEDVGFRTPSFALTFFWLAAFLVLAIAQESFASGDETGGSWRGKYDSTGILVRIVAVGLIYPLVEEFFFRGVFLGVLRKRFGVLVAVVVPALLFGLIHVQYDWPVWIVADGLLFGIARVSTGSVYVPMLLHALGNLYAVWERLAG